MKTCTKCGEEKGFEDFYKSRGQCKECVKQRAREYSKTGHAKKVRREYDWSEAGKKVKRRAREKYNKTDRYKKYHRGAMLRYRGLYPEKQRAHGIKAYALLRGVLKRSPCSVCGSTERIHGHHEDYSKPLDVIWLCAQHHKDLHNHKISLPEWAK